MPRDNDTINWGVLRPGTIVEIPPEHRERFSDDEDFDPGDDLSFDEDDTEHEDHLEFTIRDAPTIVTPEEVAPDTMRGGRFTNEELEAMLNRVRTTSMAEMEARAAAGIIAAPPTEQTAPAPHPSAFDDFATISIRGTAPSVRAFTRRETQWQITPPPMPTQLGGHRVVTFGPDPFEIRSNDDPVREASMNIHDAAGIEICDTLALQLVKEYTNAATIRIYNYDNRMRIEGNYVLSIRSESAKVYLEIYSDIDRRILRLNQDRRVIVREDQFFNQDLTIEKVG